MSTDVAPAPAAQPRLLFKRYGRGSVALTGRIAVFVGFVAAWQVASTQTDLVPSVASTVEALVDGFRDGTIGPALEISAKAILSGFAIAVVAGVLCGLWLGRSRFWGRVLEPIVTTFYAVPRIVLYPVLLSIYGIGTTSERSLAIISAFFPIAVNSIAGIKSVDPTLIKLGRSVSASRLQMIRKILFPAASPAIMVGVRIGWSSAFVTVVAAELIASKGGLGQLLSTSYNLQQYPAMFAIVLLVTVLALTGSVALWWLERRIRSNVE